MIVTSTWHRDALCRTDSYLNENFIAKLKRRLRMMRKSENPDFVVSMIMIVKSKALYNKGLCSAALYKDSLRFRTQESEPEPACHGDSLPQCV
jgi:hypothetical protein